MYNREHLKSYVVEIGNECPFAIECCEMPRVGETINLGNRKLKVLAIDYRNEYEFNWNGKHNEYTIEPVIKCRQTAPRKPRYSRIHRLNRQRLTN